jgi:hypothetical protein
MARVVGDICAPLGKYIDRQTQEEKTKWGKCGILLETDNGMRIKLDMLPAQVGESGLWLSVFEPRDNQGSGQAQQQKPAQNRSESAPTQPDVPF